MPISVNDKPMTAYEEAALFGDGREEEAIRYYETWIVDDPGFTEDILCEATNDDEFKGEIYHLLNADLDQCSDAWKARVLEKLSCQIHKAGWIVADGVMENDDE